jgi:hypothetical protein
MGLRLAISGLFSSLGGASRAHFPANKRRDPVARQDTQRLFSAVIAAAGGGCALCWLDPLLAPSVHTHCCQEGRGERREQDARGRRGERPLCIRCCTLYHIVSLLHSLHRSRARWGGMSTMELPLQIASGCRLRTDCVGGIKKAGENHRITAPPLAARRTQGVPGEGHKVKLHRATCWRTVASTRVGLQ